MFVIGKKGKPVFRCVFMITLLLAGCAEKHEFITKCRGSLIVLNTDKWQPTKSDIAMFEQICPEGR